MEKSELFAFYGSLRRGMDNYEKYKSMLEFVECTRIYGYELYSLAAYPYAVRTNDPTASIVVEIFQLKGASVRSEIHQLEIDAGYYFDLIHLNNQQVGIYLFAKPLNDPKVESGDWVSFYGK